MVTTSLAAMARISAQETTPGHFFSTSALARTTVSKPSPARDTLSGASFSASLSRDAMMTDASHPYKVDFHHKHVSTRKAYSSLDIQSVERNDDVHSMKFRIRLVGR